MGQRSAVILALAALTALTLTALTTSSQAEDAERTVNLSPGCNMTTLTFADGTDAAALNSAVSPSGALQTVWRLDNATGSFEAYMPQAPQASDLTSINLLDAVFVCVDASSSIAPPSISMPAVSPDPSGATFAIDLAPGCNAVGLSFADGTTPSQVGDAVTPPTAFESMWRHAAAQRSFQAFVAAAPQASDLTSLQFLDAVFICTGEPGTLEMPPVTGTPPPVAEPEPLVVFVGLSCLSAGGTSQLTISVRAEAAEGVGIKRVKVLVGGTTEYDSGDISDQNLRTFERTVRVSGKSGTHTIRVTVEGTGGVKPVERTGTATLGKGRCSAQIG